MATKVVNKSGIGFLPLLCLLFVGLKLTGYVAWSWWWVLAPLWIPASLGLTILGVAYCWFVKK